MASQVGNKLGYAVTNYLGLVDYSKNNIIPIEAIFGETGYIAGDKVVFDVRDHANFDFTTEKGLNGDCNGAQRVCLGTQQFSMEMKKYFNKVFPFDNCRVSLMNGQSSINQDTVNSMVAGVERDFAKQFSKYAINQLVSNTATKHDTITDFVPTSAINTNDEIIQALTDLMNKHETMSNDYTLVITNSVKSELMLSNIDCCDILNYVAPEGQNKFNVANIVVVPDSYLNDGTTQYKFVLYLKDRYRFGWNCEIAQTSEGTNEYVGQINYTKKMSWDIFFDELVEPFTELQNIGGHKVSVTP